jgi:hypothetical protein
LQHKSATQQVLNQGSNVRNINKFLPKIASAGKLQLQIKGFWPRNQGGKAETSPYLCLPKRFFFDGLSNWLMDSL